MDDTDTSYSTGVRQAYSLFMALIISCTASACTTPEPATTSAPASPPAATVQSATPSKPTASVQNTPAMSADAAQADLLAELKFGTGGAANAIPLPPACSDAGPPIVWKWAYPHNVIGEDFYINGCNFPPGESITVRIKPPNEQPVEFSSVANDIGRWSIGWTSLPEDPIGIYEALTVSASGRFKTIHSVAAPAVPTVRALCEGVLQEGNILLTGFEPMEEVLLALYTPLSNPSSDTTHELTSHQTLTVDSTGTAVASTPVEPGVRIVALGSDLSGSLTGAEGASIKVSDWAAPVDCTDPLPSLSSMPTGSALNIPDAEVSTIRFCGQPCDGTNASESLSGDRQEVYFSWDYSGFQPGMHYTREWFSRGESWVSYDCIWQGPESGQWNGTLGEPGGLRSGAWLMVITVEDVVVASESVYLANDSEYWEPAGPQPCEDF